MRNGDIQKCCQVPLLGLRLHNEKDGRGVAPAKALGSGATTTLEDYSLGPLDRRKGLSWRKQELITCQTELNCLLCHTLPNLVLLSCHMPVFSVMYPHSTSSRQKFCLISLLHCLTFKKSPDTQTSQQSRVCFLTIL